ncbi:MAG: DNA cytosine methyltransferase [Dehalococcoidia bacterium]|nr:DNA cytosine methyltransferase [Dehalococcoidia bacterium]
MSKLRLLDLFCGAGGAAKGYQRAGFYVVGVDIKPQPHYCGDEFYQADALTYPLEGFGAYHASPPCQDYAVTRSIPNRDSSRYPRLIDPIRERFKASGKPYVIENPPPAPLCNPLMLCGSMFGLRTRRHRLFECYPPIYFAPMSCNHSGRVKKPGNGKSLNIYIKDSDDCNVTVAGHLFSLKAGSKALGIDWMSRDELAEAIPPPYTEFIGKRLMEILS